MLQLNPDRLKIGYVVLIAGRKLTIEKLQEKAGFGDSAKWTHIVGCLGGLSVIDATFPRLKISDLQRRYVDKGYQIKVLRRRNQGKEKRYKVALWWATMNNLTYDILQFFWFPIAIICSRLGVMMNNIFGGRRRFVCSELIAGGFYKEGDCLFDKPPEKALPADFDDPELFEEISDIWQG